MSNTLVRIVTSNPDERGASEAVEFDAEAVVIRHTAEGVRITPSPLAGENTLGFQQLFYPWSEVRQIKEFIRA